MTKKFVSILLSLMLVFSTMSTVFAADNPKNEFSDRLDATFARLAAENKTANRYGDTNPIVERLAKGAYEYVISMNFDLADVASFDIKNTFNALPSANKFLDQMSLALKMDPQNTTKIDLNIYGDKDKLSLNVPNISNKYYYLNKSDYKKWDASELAENLGITSDTFKAIDSYFNMLMFTESNLANYQLPEGLSVPYENLLKTYLDNGTYRANGLKIVDSGRGNLAAEKYTLTLRGPMIERFQSDLVSTIRRDKNIREYLDGIYGSMSAIAGGVDMTDMVIESVCELIEGIEFGDYIKYSIYVGNSGYIIKHEFTCGEDNSDEDYYLAINTSGKSYLLDDLKFAVGSISKSTGEKAGGCLSMTGSHVAPDGVFSSKFSVDMDAFGEESELFAGTLSYDATKSANNFNLIVNLNESAMGMSGKIVVPGSIEINNETNVINMDFSNIKATFGEESMSMGMSIKFAPIDPSVVNVPDTSQVNFMELTDEELTDLSDKIENAFGNM